MDRLKIDILGVSEMRWPNSGHCQVNEHQIYYAGNDDRFHLNGVGFIVNDKVKKAVKNIVPISDRVILLQINAHPFPLNIIQIYAPTCNASDPEVENMYSDIKTALKVIKPSEMAIIMGDFNAKVGYGRRSNIVGAYGLGNPNDLGDRLVQFCQEESLVICNTHFQLHPRRLYTWTSNADRNVRNQIDFITVNERFKNAIKNAKTYPGADLNTDHSVLVATIKLKLKACQKKNQASSVDVKKLDDVEVYKAVQQDLTVKLKDISKDVNTDDIETTWTSISKAIKDTSETMLKPSRNLKRKEWMTEEILQLMDVRRSFKGRDQDKYNQVQRQIRTKIRLAKEDWFSKECAAIEDLDAKHDFFNLHKKVKQASGYIQRRNTKIMVDKDGNLLINEKEKLKEWEKYITTLFHDDRGPNQTISTRDIIEITKEEVKHAIRSAKKGKAAGPDGLKIELLKLLEEEECLMLLVKLFNSIYKTGILPNEWLKSTFIPLPKKRNAKSCKDHRTIALMSHALKLFLKIIHARIYKKCEENIGNSQFGFRNGFGTREALFGLQVLIQRCRDVTVDVFVCFLDHQTAFDLVKHDKLIEILKDLHLDDSDIQIISNLY